MYRHQTSDSSLWGLSIRGDESEGVAVRGRAGSLEEGGSCRWLTAGPCTGREETTSTTLAATS